MVELKICANNEWTNVLDSFVVQILNAHNLLIGLLAGRYIGRFFITKVAVAVKASLSKKG